MVRGWDRLSMAEQIEAVENRGERAETERDKSAEKREQKTEEDAEKRRGGERVKRRRSLGG